MAEDLGAVLDAPEIESGAEEVESGAEQVEEGAEAVEQAEGAETTTAAKDDPYTTKFSREFRAATKAWEQAHPEQAKFARQARENHARIFALQQLEPKGIDGVRERYSLLDGLAHGELKGPEALTAIQEDLAGIEQLDEQIAQGNAEALKAFGPEFDAGLAKLAPAILQRILSADPGAHEAIMLPEHVKFLAGSDLVKEYNALIDVLNTQNDPRFDEKTKMQFAIAQLAKMGTWLNGLQSKAGEVKLAPNAGAQPNDLTTRQTALEKQEQEFHWTTKIQPTAAAHENKTFETLFDPYQKRLRLDSAAKQDLMQAFKAGLNKAGGADKDYMRQMGIYRNQKNPDPATVQNYVKNAINKHSKAVMESLIKARYGPFLAGTPRAATTAPVKPGTRPAAPAGVNVEIRTVKPPQSEIDFKHTPIPWLREHKYKLYNGKTIQVRAVN